MALGWQEGRGGLLQVAFRDYVETMRSAAWLISAVLVGGGLSCAASPQATPPVAINSAGHVNVEQIRPFTGRPVEIKRVACRANNKPDLMAAMYLEQMGPASFQIVRMEYNDPAKAMLEAAKSQGSPQIEKYYKKYVTGQQRSNRLVLNALIGTWKLFGLKFDWDKATYYCRFL